MDLSERSLLLSIRPRYVEMILAGEKTTELRRTVPAVCPGAVAVIYSSTPTRAIVGTCVIGDVEVRSRTTIWDTYRESSGVTRAEFRSYFEGAERAVAIQLDCVRSLSSPIPLTALRKLIDGFRPPQSFAYVGGDFFDAIGLRAAHRDAASDLRSQAGSAHA